MHLGATHRLAHAVPLEGDTVAAAQDGTGAAAAHAGARVQLVFDQPVFVVPGDRFILRNAQGTRTVGGGVVLDPQASSSAAAAAQSACSGSTRWKRLVGAGDRAGGDARPLRLPWRPPASRGLLDAAARPLAHTRLGRCRRARLRPRPGRAVLGAALGALGGNADVLWLSPAVWAQVQARIVGALERHHARAPGRAGPQQRTPAAHGLPGPVGLGAALPG